MRPRVVLIVLIVASSTIGSVVSARVGRSPAHSSRSNALAVDVEPLPPGARIEIGPRVRDPVSMAFAPDGTWVYTERLTGVVRWVDANGFAWPLYRAPVAAPFESERGLIGITFDPNFASNGHIYIFYTGSPGGGVIENYVERLTLQSGSPLSPTRVLTVSLDSNQTLIHNGGNVHFGPDGKLYVSIGDYFNAANGQDLSKMPAKIHRFNPTAPLSAPTDNPLYDGGGPHADSTFAFGFRNPFDFDFDPVSGVLLAGDNGVACDDEVNRVLPGYNYGWRTNYLECDDSSPGGPDPAYNTIPPLISWPYSVAPTGVTFYRGDLFPEWKNDLFACHWKSGALHHFKLNGARDAIVSHTILADPALGTVLCHVDIETGRGGALYFFRNDPLDQNKEYRHIARLTRDATIYASTFEPSTRILAAGESLTYTMRLVHYGTLTTTFSIVSSLPPSTTLVDGSPQASGGAIGGSGAGVDWTGSILPNTVLTATYRATVSDQITSPVMLTNTLTIWTDIAGSTQRVATIVVNGRAAYLPLVLRQFAP